MYLNTWQITYLQNGKRGTVNIDPENFRGFMKVHPDYKLVSIKKIRNWML